MLFQLHLLINTGEYPQYPYVATCPETTRIIVLCDEHIGIIEKEDTVFFQDDYMPVSRNFEFDLPMIDSWIKAYTNQDEYSLLNRFGEEKHITLTYHSPTNESPKAYDIFENYPEERARELVKKLYPLMAGLKTVIEDETI